MNRIIKICCLLCFSCQAGLSQNGISFGVNIGSHIDFVEIKDNKAVDFIEESVKSQIDFNFGLQLQYNLSKRIFLRSGLVYQKSNYEHKLLGILEKGNPWNDLAWRTEKNISVKAIRIPLELGYNFPIISQKLNFYVGIGGTLNINLENKSTGIFYQGGMTDIELKEVDNEINESDYSIGIFTGIEISNFDKVIFGIEPKIEYNRNEFTLYLFESEALSQVQLGLTLRIRTK